MELEFMGILLIPILSGILEVIKPFIKNTDVIPVISLILGLVMGAILFRENIVFGILSGIQLGLGAVGLYSSGKSTLNLTKNEVID